MILQVFAIIFLISLFGTIPPATINITVMQLSLKKQAKSAVFLSLGAAMLDTVYAGLAVKIQQFLSDRIEVTNYFYLLAALVLIFLGVASLLSKPTQVAVEIKDDRRMGFVKGLILGALNPLAMPFWLGVTSYLLLQDLISLEGANYWSYIAGVFLGEFGMLMVIVRIGNRFKRVSDNRMIVNTIPGIALLVLGVINMVQWALFYWN